MPRQTGSRQPESQTKRSKEGEQTERSQQREKGGHEGEAQNETAKKQRRNKTKRTRKKSTTRADRQQNKKNKTDKENKEEKRGEREAKTQRQAREYFFFWEDSQSTQHYIGLRVLNANSSLRHWGNEADCFFIQTMCCWCLYIISLPSRSGVNKGKQVTDA